MLGLGLSSPAQTDPTIPKDFVEIDVTNLSVEEKSKLNFSTKEFGVSQKKGKLIVEKRTYQSGVTLEVPSGLLIGNNRGEWGGELMFQAKGGKNSLVKVKDGNIVQLFNYQGKVLSIEGIAHLSYNQGALYEIHAEKQPISYTKIFHFEDAPVVLEIEKDRLIIISSKNLYVVNGLEKELVFEKTFWSGLYPNSITKFDDENIFIGMRSGIAKVDLKNKKLSFYKYIGK